MSDISGQEIHAHNGNNAHAISELASWLRAESRDQKIPGGKAINREFLKFRKALPLLLKEIKLAKNEVTFLDFYKLAEGWIVSQP